ncbi:MAG: hypothetical protein R3F05_20985, partial [Planctomycetota bacterium]
GWATGGVLLEGTVEAGGEAAQLVFDAANRKDVLVHIVDPEGEPVPRAKLRIMSGDTAGSYGGRSVLVEGGTHTLHRGRLKRFLQLTVTEPRSADGEPLPLCSETVEVAVSEATEVRIRLRPGAEVRGRVLGPADEPVAGVMVTAQPWSASASVDAGRSAQTDERGEFVISVLPPGPTLLGIRDRTRRWRLVDSVEIVAPQAGVVLRVVESTTLEVVVVDASREPLPGVTVFAESAQSTRRSVTGKTDAQGRVQLGGFDDGELIDVRAVLMIGAAEAGWTLGPVRARAPGRTELVRTGTLSLRGTVVDEEGKPLGLVAVTVGHGRAYATRGRATSQPVTGTFEFANLMPGPARVWIGYDNHNHLPTEPVDVELPAGDVQIVLRKTVGVQGRLLVPDPHAWQIVWAVEMGAGGGEIDEQGRFRIPHARGPRGAIIARPRDMRDARVAILEDVDPKDGPFELVETAAGTITGRISGWSSGQRRANYVTVSAERGPLRFPADPVAEDGTFVIGGLPPGLWTLRATTPLGSTQLGGVPTGSRHQMLDMPDAGHEAAAAPR